MTVLVAIPFFGVPHLIERCVRSVLAQTVRDLACVVIGDGEEPPLRVRDSRLTVLTLPYNRGPYFCQQVVLAASPHRWYAVVGADDWLDPWHLERLAATGSDAAVPTAIWLHAYGEPVRIHRGAFEVGLYATERLRRIGGHNPAERLGQDSLMRHLLRMTGGVVDVPEPTYHRVKRSGSLTTDPATGHRSAVRREVRARNRAVVAHCRTLRRRSAIREYRLGLVPPDIAAEVEEQAARLRVRLGKAAA